MSLGSGFVQIEVLIPTDEAIHYVFGSPHTQIHMQTGDGSLWLTQTVWGRLSRAFSGISSGFIP